MPKHVKSEHTAPGHKLRGQVGLPVGLAAVTQLLPCTRIYWAKGFKPQTANLRSQKKTISVCLETFLLHLISLGLAEKSGMGNEFLCQTEGREEE